MRSQHKKNSDKKTDNWNLEWAINYFKHITGLNPKINSEAERKLFTEAFNSFVINSEKGLKDSAEHWLSICFFLGGMIPALLPPEVSNFEVIFSNPLRLKYKKRNLDVCKSVREGRQNLALELCYLLFLDAEAGTSDSFYWHCKDLDNDLQNLNKTFKKCKDPKNKQSNYYLHEGTVLYYQVLIFFDKWGGVLKGEMLKIWKNVKSALQITGDIYDFESNIGIRLDESKRKLRSLKFGAKVNYSYIFKTTQQNLEQGAKWEEANEYRLALEYYQAAHNAHLKNPLPLLKMALVYYKLELFEACVQKCNEAEKLQIEPRNPLIDYDFDILTESSLLDLYRARGASYLHLKKYPEAEINLRQEYFKKICDYGTILQHAICCLQISSKDNNFLNTALNELQFIIKHQPKNTEALYYYGLCLCVKGSYREALPIFSQLLNQDQKHNKGVYLHALCYIQIGDLESASYYIDAISKAIPSYKTRKLRYSMLTNLAFLAVRNGLRGPKLKQLLIPNCQNERECTDLIVYLRSELGIEGFTTSDLKSFPPKSFDKKIDCLEIETQIFQTLFKSVYKDNPLKQVNMRKESSVSRQVLQPTHGQQIRQQNAVNSDQFVSEKEKTAAEFKAVKAQYASLSEKITAVEKSLQQGDVSQHQISSTRDELLRLKMHQEALKAAVQAKDKEIEQLYKFKEQETKAELQLLRTQQKELLDQIQKCQRAAGSAAKDDIAAEKLAQLTKQYELIQKQIETIEQAKREQLALKQDVATLFSKQQNFDAELHVQRSTAKTLIADSSAAFKEQLVSLERQHRDIADKIVAKQQEQAAVQLAAEQSLSQELGTLKQQQKQKEKLLTAELAELRKDKQQLWTQISAIQQEHQRTLDEIKAQEAKTQQELAIKFEEKYAALQQKIVELQNNPQLTAEQVQQLTHYVQRLSQLEETLGFKFEELTGRKIKLDDLEKVILQSQKLIAELSAIKHASQSWEHLQQELIESQSKLQESKAQLESMQRQIGSAAYVPKDQLTLLAQDIDHLTALIEDKKQKLALKAVQKDLIQSKAGYLYQSLNHALGQKLYGIYLAASDILTRNATPVGTALTTLSGSGDVVAKGAAGFMDFLSIPFVSGAIKMICKVPGAYHKMKEDKQYTSVAQSINGVHQDEVVDPQNIAIQAERVARFIAETFYDTCNIRSFSQEDITIIVSYLVETFCAKLLMGEIDLSKHQIEEAFLSAVLSIDGLRDNFNKMFAGINHPLVQKAKSALGFPQVALDFLQKPGIKVQQANGDWIAYSTPKSDRQWGFRNGKLAEIQPDMKKVDIKIISQQATVPTLKPVEAAPNVPQPSVTSKSIPQKAINKQDLIKELHRVTDLFSTELKKNLSQMNNRIFARFRKDEKCELFIRNILDFIHSGNKSIEILIGYLAEEEIAIFKPGSLYSTAQTFRNQLKIVCEHLLNAENIALPEEKVKDKTQLPKIKYNNIVDELQDRLKKGLNLNKTVNNKHKVEITEAQRIEELENKSRQAELRTRELEKTISELKLAIQQGGLTGVSNFPAIPNAPGVPSAPKIIKTGNDPKKREEEEKRLRTNFSALLDELKSHSSKKSKGPGKASPKSKDLSPLVIDRNLPTTGEKNPSEHQENQQAISLSLLDIAAQCDISNAIQASVVIGFFRANRDNPEKASILDPNLLHTISNNTGMNLGFWTRPQSFATLQYVQNEMKAESRTITNSPPPQWSGA